MRHKKLLIGGLIICLALGVLLWIALGNSIEQKSVSEINAEGTALYGEKLGVRGQIVSGSVEHLRDTGGFRLIIHDEKDETETLSIIYDDSLPQQVVNESAATVTAEGKLQEDGLFHATKITAACASHYEKGES